MKKYSLIIIVFILSCQRKEIRNNSQEDIKSAKEFVTNFYKNLSELDTLEIYNYLDTSIPKNELGKLIKKNYKEYGNINKVDIIDVTTSNVVENNNSEINSEIKVLVTYDNVKCNETISFVKRNNDSPKLEGYLTQEILE